MTAKNQKPLTQPRKGEPNHGKFCNAPGSLPPESSLPMQPSLKEQMHGTEKDPVQVPPFDYKACILCDHVIVQKILGNKCGKSGSLCCNLRSCPIEDRKKIAIELRSKANEMISNLKRIYCKEQAILDYIEMIECEIMALEENERCTLP